MPYLLVRGGELTEMELTLEHSFIEAMNKAVAHVVQNGGRLDVSNEKQIVAFLDGVIRELEAPPAAAHEHNPELLGVIRAAVNGTSGPVGPHNVKVAKSGAVTVAVALPGGQGVKTLAYINPLEAAKKLEDDIKPLLSLTVHVSAEVTARARKIFELVFASKCSISSAGAARLLGSMFDVSQEEDVEGDGDDDEL